MPIIPFLTLILATWRVSHLLAQEEGPEYILDTFRYWLGVRYEENEPYAAKGTNVFSKGIICIWCNSVWVGLVFGLLYIIWHPLWFLALPFALSAGAILVNETLEALV